MKFKMITIVSILFSLNTYGALPPQCAAQNKYELMQNVEKIRLISQDVVVIQVTDVQLYEETRDQCPSIEHWNIKAIIQEVKKGTLKKEDRISIAYTEERYRCPGPQRYYPKELKNKILTSAYLKCFDKDCSLSSGAWSFHSEPEFQFEFEEVKQKNTYWQSEILYEELNKVLK